MTQAAANEAPVVLDEEQLKLKAELLDWPDADVVWLSKQPKELQPIARRYKRRLFSLTMQAGATNMAVQIILGARPPKQVAQAAMVISGSYNNLFLLALEHIGATPELFQSCKEDVERVAALMDDGKGGARSAGGIILSS